MNPTGDVFSRAEVEEVANFARDSGIAVISDEAYEDLIYSGDEHVSPASFPGMFERTISVFTLSKTYSMTGWRAGYILVPKRWRLPMQTAVLYSINGVSTPTQWAMLEAMRSAEAFLEDARAGYRKRRDALVAGLRAAGFEIEAPKAARTSSRRSHRSSERNPPSPRAPSSTPCGSPPSRASSSVRRARRTCASPSRCPKAPSPVEPRL